jgi:hypothetical protein
MRRGSTWSLAGALALGALATAAVAAGDMVTVLDGSTNSRANKFDISETTAGHRGARLSHEIRTYSRWRSRELTATQSRPRLIALYIWRPGSKPSGSHDYEVFAHFKKGKLRGYVLKVGRSQGKVTGRATVNRHDRYSITYTFAERAIGNPRYYRWEAVTGYTGPGCLKQPGFQFGCDDSAPTGRTKVHRLTRKA